MRAPLGQQHRHRHAARSLAPLAQAARSQHQRTAHQQEDLNEAILQLQAKLAKCGGLGMGAAMQHQPG